MAISYKVKYALIIWPNIPLLNIYPSEMETYIHMKSLMWMFIVT